MTDRFRIVLEFKIDEDALRDDLEADPCRATQAVLETTFFLMPVKFRIENTELLTYPAVYEDWRPLPIIGVAVSLAAAIEEAEVRGASEVVLEDGGSLHFRRIGSQICAWNSNAPDRRAFIRWPALLSAAVRFRREVRDFLGKRAPALETHAAWKSWFPDD